MESAFKDVSFSSYLKPQNHIQNPQENGMDDAELSVFDACKYFSASSNLKDVKTHKQQEIPDDVLSVPRLSSVSSIDGYGRNFPTRSFRGTPTASSEVSWNSRTGLLANPQIKNLPARKKGSAVKKWFLRRKCCCSGNKAVQIKEVKVSEHKGAEVIISTETKINDGESNCLYTKMDLSNKEIEPRSKSIAVDPLPLSPDIVGFGSMEAPRKQRISASGRPFLDGAISFTFPILNPSAEQVNKPAPAVIGAFPKPIVNLNKQTQRESHPVSGPPLIGDCVSGRSDFSPRIAIADDDAGSDASSDLFEIENFATQTAASFPICTIDEDPAIVKRFHSVGGINCVEYEGMSADDSALAECYAPSEASIDWSVATAEGGDRANVGNFSSVSGAASLKQRWEEPGEKMKGNTGLMFMGCRQEKAVSVAPHPVRCLAADGGRPSRAGKSPGGNCQSARLSAAFAA